MTWILIIAIGGFVGVNDVKYMQMTEAQCRIAVKEFKPLKGAVGAVCVGPEGQKFSLDEVK